MPFYKVLILRLIPIAVLAALWQWFGSSRESLLFPTFLETIAAAADLLTSQRLWDALWLSHQAMFLGFGLALLAGIPLGILSGYSTAFDSAIAPYIRLLIVVPKSALVPVFILALGIGAMARAWVIFIYVIVYIVVNVRTGVREVDSNLVLMARSFGASRLDIGWRILLMGAIPALLAGLRISLGRAMSGMITVELLLSAVGIGRLILLFRGEFDAASTYAVISIVLVEALLLSSGLRWLNGRLTQWAT